MSIILPTIPWPKVKKPDLGRVKKLHQMREGEKTCLRCGKPFGQWKPCESCPGNPIDKAA